MVSWVGVFRSWVLPGSAAASIPAGMISRSAPGRLEEDSGASTSSSDRISGSLSACQLVRTGRHRCTCPKASTDLTTEATAVESRRRGSHSSPSHSSRLRCAAGSFRPPTSLSLCRCCTSRARGTAFHRDVAIQKPSMIAHGIHSRVAQLHHAFSILSPVSRGIHANTLDPGHETHTLRKPLATQETNLG